MTQDSGKSFLIKKVLVSLLFIVLPILFLTYPFIGSYFKMAPLESAAAEKEKTLSDIRILDLFETEANGYVSGDALTAQPDPRQSTFASASFENLGGRPIDEVYREVTDNLQSAGYMMEKQYGDDALTVSDSTGRTIYLVKPRDGSGRLNARYIKDGEVIKVNYFLSPLKVHVQYSDRQYYCADINC